ncbi:MAG TPA: hypothetical protein VED63_08075 [Acidimicrobiales bacterium]|nr:hypothetical protein [Acidimicrobiales bacterium]
MGTEELAERLAALAEELADMAIDRLQAAQASVHTGGDPDPVLIAEERRITRARRAVEKAASLLGAPAEEDHSS